MSIRQFETLGPEQSTVRYAGRIRGDKISGQANHIFQMRCKDACSHRSQHVSITLILAIAVVKGYKCEWQHGGKDKILARLARRSPCKLRISVFRPFNHSVVKRFLSHPALVSSGQVRWIMYDCDTPGLRWSAFSARCR